MWAGTDDDVPLFYRIRKGDMPGNIIDCQSTMTKKMQKQAGEHGETVAQTMIRPRGTPGHARDSRAQDRRRAGQGGDCGGH